MSKDNDRDPVRKEILLQTQQAWNGDKYISYPKGSPELTILKITIQPNSVVDWHFHEMPNAGMVLSGHITVEEKSSGAIKLISEGQALAETVNTIHRGFTDEQEAVLIVFYAGTSGMPLSSPTESDNPPI